MKKFILFLMILVSVPAMALSIHKNASQDENLVATFVGNYTGCSTSATHLINSKYSVNSCKKTEVITFSYETRARMLREIQKPESINSLNIICTNQAAAINRLKQQPVQVKIVQFINQPTKKEVGGWGYKSNPNFFVQLKDQGAERDVKIKSAWIKTFGNLATVAVGGVLYRDAHRSSTKTIYKNGGGGEQTPTMQTNTGWTTVTTDSMTNVGGPFFK